MVDRDIVYVSPSSVLRTLTEVGLNTIWTQPAGKAKRKGFIQPTAIHQHWHTDISYVNFRGTFLFLIAVLEGASRAILAWNLCERMETLDVDLVVRRAHEEWIEGTDFQPRVISDNGPQYISNEFKRSIKELGLEHTRIRVAHPQSNGKMERFNGTAKREKIRQMPQVSIEQMKAEFGEWIEYYHQERLHSGIGYVTPYDVLFGRREKIVAEREDKLKKGRVVRADKNKNMNCKVNLSKGVA